MSKTSRSILDALRLTLRAQPRSSKRSSTILLTNWKSRNSLINNALKGVEYDTNLNCDPEILTMKSEFPKGILSAAVLAARVLCNGQVYSASIPSFAERHNLPTNYVTLLATVPAPHQPDEVLVANYSHGVGSVTSYTEWYVSTNALAKQPRWDGFSKEAPLSIGRASALALPNIKRQFPEVKSWAIESVWLRNVFPDQGVQYPDVWCYEITFRPRDAESGKRLEDDANTCPQQVVLLDGTVVPPRVCKSK